jgi:hypothetical protein
MDADSDEDAEMSDEEVDESWMDDLDESLELDTVEVNMKKPGEVGSGKFSRAETNTKSAVASGARPEMGGRAVQIKSRGHTGYSPEAGPKSQELPQTNRRRKAMDDVRPVSKEGDPRAMLNRDRTDGFGAVNVRSPLGSQGTTPKK